MNIRLFLVPLLVNAGLVAGCTSVECRPAPPEPPQTVAAEPDVPAATENTVPQTTITKSSSAIITPKAERVLADSSKLTTTTDEAGTKVETRIFGKGSAVSMVIVRTAPDGQKRVELYYNDSSSRSAGGSASNLALSAPASEIESRLGLKPAVTPTGSNTNTETPVELAREMPRDEHPPIKPSETPAPKQEKVVAVPQLPPVR